MSTTLIGKEHNVLLNWLVDNWINSNSPVCFLEGFPGTGKTAIARALLDRVISSGIPAVMITAPETEKDPTDDLLLDLAGELNSAGKTELAQAIENNRPLLDVLSNLVNDPLLIIIDDFQRSMLGERAITQGGFAKVLSSLANRQWLKGRILLITNRLVERARWSEPYSIRTITGMSPEDGVDLLEFYAKEGNRIDEIAQERRQDVVKWLGGNPRAIRLLVRNMVYESLDDLIGLQPELWEMKDREVSETLVEDLERHLLERALHQFPENYHTQLFRLSVHRKPFKRQAIEILFNDKSEYVLFRDEMIDRFLMEQHKGWFSLHPVVREIGMRRLLHSPEELQQAHSIVAPYYTRHFQAKQIVGWGALGGHFVEARYHLTKADKSDELKNIALRFQNYIFSTLSAVSPVPDSAEDLDERIAVLSALLEAPGPKSLEYHLARLFYVRNQRNDLMRALQHIDRAKNKSDYVDAWFLCGAILAKMEKSNDAINVLKEGIDRIPAEKNAFTLYDRLSQLLVEREKPDEAIKVLRQGIDRIPAEKSAFALYDRLSQLLVEREKPDEAIKVLRQGIDRIPAEKNAFALYDRLSQLLVEREKPDEAIKVLRQGIDRIPANKSLSTLYSCYALILVKEKKIDDAVEILRQGLNRVYPDQRGTLVDSLIRLYAMKNNDLSMVDLIKEIENKRLPNLELARIFLFQIQGHWDKAAECAKQGRKFGYLSLLSGEAFSWLCANQPNQALETALLLTDERRSYKYWLLAFIYLRLGNAEKARKMLASYNPKVLTSIAVDEKMLINEWIKPPTDLKQLDLAFCFPILPPTLTGLPQSITMLSYQSHELKTIDSMIANVDIHMDDKPKNAINISMTFASMSEQYIDFDLHIASDGHIVASSFEGQVTEQISTQIPSNIKLSLQLIERRQTDTDLLKEVGKTLYAWLFPGAIHTHLQQTEAVARNEKKKLRLRLRIESAPIASLPLEFIYRETGGYFMAVNPDTVLSRYLNLPVPPEFFRRRENPLHMLTIIADPTDQVRLNPEEWESIVKEAISRPLADGRMTFSTVKRATRKEIRNALLAQKPDIIQFVGHGVYENGKGQLALVDEDTNETWLVDDERFANIFMGFGEHLGLFVMATCESAKSDDPQCFLGIAPQLVQRGIPAVVAMQYSVYIKTVKVFLDDFYTAVAARKPIDWAVQSARNGISIQFGLDNREFAMPVLYMRAKDGNVF